MIIPDTLSPLPVLPRSGDATSEDTVAPEDFVCERTVRQLLVGPLSAIDPETGLVPADHDFAGRADVAAGVKTPFVSRRNPAVHTDAPAKAFVPGEPHPALAEPRRSAPPRPRPLRPQADAPTRQQDRLWVFGMGLALLLVLATGALVQLFAAHAEPPPPVEVGESLANPEPPPSIASTEAAMP